MEQFEVTNSEETYIIEAESKDKARKEILKKEGITMKRIELEDVGDTTGDWIYLEQDDPRWGNVKMGNSNSTLKAYGCLVTNLSMMSYWYGNYFKPDEIAKKANFTKEGYYIWQSGDVFLPFDFVYRYYNRDAKKIKDILYSKDNACVVRVRLGNAFHWLSVIGFDEKNNKFIGADPLTGDSCYIEDRYGLINGFAEIKRK